MEKLGVILSLHLVNFYTGQNDPVVASDCGQKSWAVCDYFTLIHDFIICLALFNKVQTIVWGAISVFLV